jgi:hypothetical protein
MQKWEYCTRMFDTWKHAEEFQALGDDGWELVAALRPEPDKAVFIYYFKRLKS